MICAAKLPTLMEFLDEIYIPSRIDLCQEAIRQMRISIGRFEAWAKRELSLADLSEDTLRAFLCDYRKSHSAATTNSKRCQILALWNCAWDEELLQSPPRARKIRKAKLSPQIPEAWTAEEIGLIIQAALETTGIVDGLAAGDWWASLLLVAYDTGERRSAIMRTRTADVSLSEGSICFPVRKNKIPRWCPLATDTIAACTRIYSQSRDLLWPWPNSREWLDKCLRAILKRAGVSFGRTRGGLFHKFKRTSGTICEAAGGDGARHTGTTRKVFEAHYLDPRFFDRGNLNRLPRPSRVSESTLAK